MYVLPATETQYSSFSAEGIDIAGRYIFRSIPSSSTNDRLDSGSTRSCPIFPASNITRIGRCSSMSGGLVTVFENPSSPLNSRINSSRIVTMLNLGVLSGPGRIISTPKESTHLGLGTSIISSSSSARISVAELVRNRRSAQSLHSVEGSPLLLRCLVRKI